MKGFVGVTDNNWFAFLSQQPDIDEVNFWQPSGIILLRTINKKGSSLPLTLSCLFYIEANMSGPLKSTIPTLSSLNQVLIRSVVWMTKL